MKRLALLGALVAALLGLRHVAQRIATHQQILPRLVSRIDTQVHRINQSGPDRIFSPHTESDSQ